LFTWAELSRWRWGGADEAPGIDNPAGRFTPETFARAMRAEADPDDHRPPRAGLDPETVAQYAEDMLAGIAFPLGVVYHDGTSYRLSQGFHRVRAAEEVGR
jgi:hypothetical protein